MNYQFMLLDVFTSTPFGGNPLAVFPDALGISSSLMQKIAKELNLSETAFVVPSTKRSATHQVRIFTPTKELPFAGHPTIGTAVALASSNLRPDEYSVELVFDEGVGLIPVKVMKSKDGTYSAFLKVGPAVIQRVSHSLDQLAKLLNIRSDQIETTFIEPAQVICGVPFTMIPVKSRQVLENISMNLNEWELLISKSAAPQVYPYFVDCEKHEAFVRMFAPAFGQAEDAATGAAAAALGSYLAQKNKSLDIQTWSIHQGAQIGRKSLLQVIINPSISGIGNVELGGEAVVIGKGEILSDIHTKIDFSYVEEIANA